MQQKTIVSLYNNRKCYSDISRIFTSLRIADFIVFSFCKPSDNGIEWNI